MTPNENHIIACGHQDIRGKALKDVDLVELDNFVTWVETRGIEFKDPVKLDSYMKIREYLKCEHVQNELNFDLRQKGLI